MLPQVYESPWSITKDHLGELTLRPQHRVIDLRNEVDFNSWHLPGAINLPLCSIGPDTLSPFLNPEVLEAQWVELEQIFNDYKLVEELKAHHVLAVCYDGDTARVATSVLRAKDLKADSVRGGYHAIAMHGIRRGIEIKTGNECVISPNLPIARLVRSRGSSAPGVVRGMV